MERDFTKVKNIQFEIQKMYDKVNGDLQKEQSKYDADTEHGLNAAKQKLWNENIDIQLGELEDYIVTEIDIANK